MVTRIWSSSFLLLLALPLRAEVADSGDQGFTVKYSVEMRATPEQAYRSAVAQIHQWWSPEHTFSGSAAGLSIDGHANGCFCERLNSGGSVRHLTVVYADPGKLLRMTGGLGPLQSMAVNGVMTWSFQKTDAGTRLDLVYTVGGYAPGGLKAIAAPVDQVLKEQMDRLKAFVER